MAILARGSRSAARGAASAWMDGAERPPYFQVSVAAHWQQSPSYWRDMIAPAPNDRARADEIIAAVLMPA